MNRMFEFRCNDCGVVFDALVDDKDRHQGCKCPNCEGWGDYKISAPRFDEGIMSDKWVKTRQSHMKKERKNMERHGTYK